MRGLKLNFIDSLFLIMAIAAIPVGAYHASIGLYTQAAIALGAAAIGLALVLGWNPDAVFVAGIRQINSLQGALSVPAVATITAAQGTCTLGYEAGSIWAVDNQRELSRPICRAAGDAILSALSSAQGETTKAGRQVTCDCPLKLGRVTFAIQTG